MMTFALLAGGGENPGPPRAAGGGAGGWEASSEDARVGRFPASHFFVARDLFLPAFEPETVPADDADFLEPYDEVFGVVVNGQARAYPITMISYHHVVNDVIREAPIAVAY
jgi:hypothetical protein